MKTTAISSLDTRQRLAVVASFATMFMVGVTISLLGPSLPGLAEQTGIALPRAGIFFTLFASGALLATLVMAWLMDRPVRHALLVGAALLMGGAQWLVAGSQTLAQASIAIALTGLAMSTTGTAPNAIIADLYRERTGQALNALHLCAGLGSFIGPLLIGGALRLGSNYTLVFRLAGLVMLLVGVLWAVSLPPRPRQDAGGHAIPLARNILVPMALLLFFALLYTGTEQAFGGWIFTYAREAVRTNAIRASLTNALFWLAIMLGRLIAMRVLAHAANTTLLSGCVLLGGLGIGVVLLGSAIPLLLWVGVGLVGLGFGPVFPTTLAVGTQTAPGHAGMTSSLVIASGSVGAMVLPWASGALMPRLGLVGSMAGLIVPLAVMLGCLLFMRKNR